MIDEGREMSMPADDVEPALRRALRAQPRAGEGPTPAGPELCLPFVELITGDAEFAGDLRARSAPAL